MFKRQVRVLRVRVCVCVQECGGACVHGAMVWCMWDGKCGWCQWAVGMQVSRSRCTHLKHHWKHEIQTAAWAKWQTSHWYQAQERDALVLRFCASSVGVPSRACKTTSAANTAMGILIEPLCPHSNNRLLPLSVASSPIQQQLHTGEKEQQCQEIGFYFWLLTLCFSVGVAYTWSNFASSTVRTFAKFLLLGSIILNCHCGNWQHVGCHEWKSKIARQMIWSWIFSEISAPLVPRAQLVLVPPRLLHISRCRSTWKSKRYWKTHFHPMNWLICPPHAASWGCWECKSRSGD